MTGRGINFFVTFERIYPRSSLKIDNSKLPPVLCPRFSVIRALRALTDVVLNCRLLRPQRLFLALVCIKLDSEERENDRQNPQSVCNGHRPNETKLSRGERQPVRLWGEGL